MSLSSVCTNEGSRHAAEAHEALSRHAASPSRNMTSRVTDHSGQLTVGCRGAAASLEAGTPADPLTDRLPPCVERRNVRRRRDGPAKFDFKTTPKLRISLVN